MGKRDIIPDSKYFKKEHTEKVVYPADPVQAVKEFDSCL